MKSINTFFFIIISLFFTVNVQAEKVTVTVNTPGELGKTIDALLVEQITSLTVTGELNASDIKTLRAMGGKLNTLHTIDLKDAVIVSSDEPYYIYSYRGDGVWHTNVIRYFFSKERKYRHWADGLSQASTQYDDYYDYNLAGAFQGMPIKHIVLPSSINEIGRAEFKGCTNLVEVESVNDLVFVGEDACNGCTNLRVFPDLANVVCMEPSAFLNCASLCFDEYSKTVNLQHLDSIPYQAFKSCSSLKYVNLSSTLRFVKEDAFRNSGLVKVVFPNDYTQFGNSVFADCSCLVDIQMPEKLCKIPYDLMLNTPYYNSVLQVENGVRYIGNIAAAIDGEISSILYFKPKTTGIADNFNGNTKDSATKLHCQSVYFPPSLLYIGSYAFKGAEFENVDLPQHIYEVADCAFENCYKMDVSSFPTSLCRIGIRAFANCSNSNLIMSNQLSTIGNEAFINNKSLNKIKVSERLRTIPSGCFQGCSSIEELVIPDSISSIGNNAFNGCSNIKKLNIGEGLNEIGASTFEGLDSLRELSINAMALGSLRFEGHQRLEKVTLGPKVEIMYHDAFWKCPNLKTVYFYAQNLQTESLFDYSNIEHVVFAPNVTTIPANTFYSCRHLKQIELPDSLQTLGDGVFTDCESLQSISIGKSVQVIGNAFGGSGIQEVYFNAIDATPIRSNARIFQYCPELQKVVFGPDVQVLPRHMFYSCPKLSHVTLGKSITSIGYKAFEECGNLEEIYYNIKDFPSQFDFYELPAFKRIVFGPDVQTIPRWAFQRCSLLETPKIPGSIKIVGEYAFFECPSITRFSPEEGVEEIAHSCEGCTNLREVVIPQSINRLDWAFYDCPNINKVTALYDQSPVPFDPEYTFSADVYNNATLYVPTGTKNIYKATDGWKNFVRIVEEDSLIDRLNNCVYSDKASTTIYSISGLKSELKPGINIICTKDGSTKKMFIKSR